MSKTNRMLGVCLSFLHVMASVAVAQPEDMSSGEFLHREVDYSSEIEGLEIVRVNPLRFDASQSFEYGTAKQTGWEWDFETRVSPAYNTLQGVNAMSMGRTLPLNYGSHESGIQKFNAQRGNFYRYSYLNNGWQESELVDLQTDTRLAFKEVMIAQGSYRLMLLQSKSMRDGTTFKYEYSTDNWGEGLVCPNVNIRHVSSGATLAVKRGTPWQLGMTVNGARDHCLPTEVTLPNGVSKILYSWTAYPVTPTTIFPLLSSVTYPDGSVKTYNYQGLTAVTGGLTIMRPGLSFVTDEEGKRLVTYEWKDNKVVAAFYGDPSAPKNKVSVAENVNGTRTITDAEGVARVIKYSSWEKQVGPVGVPPVKFRRFGGMSSPCEWCTGDAKDIKYNDVGLMTQMTDQRGVVTEITRGGEAEDILRRETKRVIGVGTPEAKTITTTYDARFNLPTKRVVSDASGSYTTENTYESKGRPTKVKFTQTVTLFDGAPASISREVNISYTYFPGGEVKTMTVDGPRTDVSDIVVSTFDVSGVMVSMRDAAGTTTFGDFDWDGRPGLLTYPNGTTTKLKYDWAGRVLTSTTQGVTTTNTYYKNGLLKTTTIPGTTEKTTFVYDDARRLLSATDAAGHKLEYSYDKLGRPTVLNMRDASGALARTMTTTYANAGRTISQSSGAMPGVLVTKRNENFETIEVKDPLLKVMSTTRDALGRVKASKFVSSGLDYTAQFDVGNLVKASNYSVSALPSRGQPFQYVNDATGFVGQVGDWDTGIDNFAPDQAGNVAQTTNSYGANRVNATHDALGRVTQETIYHPTSGALLGTLNYQYDVNPDSSLPAPTGQLTGITGSFGTVQYFYDSKGQVKKKTQSRSAGASKSDAYVYDGAGRLTTITYPSGREVKMTLDRLGRPSAVMTRANAVAAWNTVADVIQYPPFGDLGDATSLRFGGGTQIAKRQFDTAGRVSAYSDGAGANLVTVVRRADGQIISLKSGATVTASYDYDSSNRLKMASGAGFVTQTYDYEATGDLKSLKEGTVTSTGIYQNNSSRLTSWGGKAWTYTQDGLVTSDGTLALTYDARGLVRTVKKGTGPLHTYTYDALGKRMSKTPAGGATTDYHYDVSGRLIAESNPATGVTLREYIWLGDRPIMLVIPGATEQRYFVYTDYANAPVRLTNATGATVWQWRRGPFGKEEPSLSTVTFNLRMPGQYYDAESGLHYNNARYYHPATGRYLQADPLGEAAGISAYTYADGDAVNLVDPSGLDHDGGPTPGVFGGIPWSGPRYPPQPRKPALGGSAGSFVSGFSFQDPYNFGGPSVFDPQEIGFQPPAEWLPPKQVANENVSTVMAILTHPDVQNAMIEAVIGLALSRVPGLGRLYRSIGGRAPNLKQYAPGPNTNFVGVLDTKTNNFSMRPGNRTVFQDGSIPKDRMPDRNGAHADVWDILMEQKRYSYDWMFSEHRDTKRFVAFTMKYEQPGKIGVEFNSVSINLIGGWGGPNVGHLPQATNPVMQLLNQRYGNYAIDIIKP